MKTKTPTNEKSKETLINVFEDLLKDMYWAEKYLVRSLPKLVKAACSDELREAMEKHLEETNQHVGRIEKCFEVLTLKAEAEKCEAMEGLVTEANEAIGRYTDPYVRDAALIAAIQKIEHYEITSYGTLRTMAKVLGRLQCAEWLEQSKDEEAEADEKMTSLAEKINMQASETPAVV
jgi:ferritin-like metal-binding protein YciE